MKVALTIAGLAPEFGGPSRSVPYLAEALSREGINVEIIACGSEIGHGTPVVPVAKPVRMRLLPARARRGYWRASNNDFFRSLYESVKTDEPTVIHDNGLWLPTNHAAARAACALKRPLVISPRGMLSTWAARHHRWRKRLAWIWFQRRDLLTAKALHATSDQEMCEFRDAGFRGPIAIVPNGVEAPQSADPKNQGVSRVRTALFLSRLHPKKGLINLVEAWANVRPANWRVVVAGNDEGSHRREIEAAVRRHNLDSTFSFQGATADHMKWRLYRDADLVILPSHSENFGIVVAEALASGVPVITTRGTPWKDLIEHHCGWWVEVGVAPLAHALREAVALTDEQRLAMGQRGRQLVESKYSWRRVATEMKSVYAWLLGEGDRPACVTLS
jgi:glycosyltransferase involved in cell wall biosynthesis